MSLEKTLQERGNTHGSFVNNAAVSQHLKAVMRKAPNWDNLTKVQHEALEVIAAKISRILSGNANEPDHWHDIQGYARLVELDVRSTEPKPYSRAEYDTAKEMEDLAKLEKILIENERLGKTDYETAKAYEALRAQTRTGFVVEVPEGKRPEDFIVKR